MMRLRSLLFVGALACTAQANAQAWVEDSVSMDANYANDIYYSLKNGQVSTSPNTNWHLAFQTTEQGAYGNVSVFANHVQGGVQVYSLHMSASTHFENLSAADTVGKTAPAQQLFNSDSSWNYGALNRLADQSNFFDYGWGTYDMGSHNVMGDSLFLINIGSGANAESYKLWIQLYDSGPTDSVHWRFRIAKLDGSEDTTIRIYRIPTYEKRLFAYLDVTTKTVFDREPDRYSWDMLFTRYKEYMPSAPGVPYYNVMGVLSNFGVLVAEMKPVTENDTAGYKGYTYVTTMNAIGSDWKYFNAPSGPWTFADTTYYFIKTYNTNEYYQLHFTGFGGQTDGKVVFKKRLLGTVPTSVGEVATPVQAYFLAPNPANNSVSVMIDSKEQAKNASLMITDLTGRVVYNGRVDVSAGMNAYNVSTANLASGTYIVTVTNGAWKIAQKLAVQH